MPWIWFCVQCKNGFTLNKPKTNCKGKKDIEVKILPQKLITINSTIKTANLSTIKSKPNPFLNKTSIVVNNTKNVSFINISISFLKGFNKEKINIILNIFLIILVLSIIFSLIFIRIKILNNSEYNEKIASEENVRII